MALMNVNSPEYKQALADSKANQKSLAGANGKVDPLVYRADLQSRGVQLANTDQEVADQFKINVGQAVPGGVARPTPIPTPTTYNPPPATVDTTPMQQAMQTFVPPAAKGLSFDQAKGQVSQQLDPMFQRALEALKAQKHQDQLNGDELGMARGGAHSGLAADLQNKVGIAAAGKASDLDATRQTQTAQMAQDLVNRGEDNDYRNRQQQLAEYLGIGSLDLQRSGQNFDQMDSTRNFDRLTGRDKVGDARYVDETAYGRGRDTVADTRYTDETQYGRGRDTILDNRYEKQLDRSNFESDRSYELAKSGQEWGQLMQKDTFDFNKAQALYENSFKERSFQKDMEEAAASRGLQWESLNQRDREFVADQAFKEKSFKADQTQRGIDNALKATGKPPNSTDYKTNPSFAEDVAGFKNDPKLIENLNKYASDFIKEYGYEGYLALRKETGIDKEKELGF